MMSLKLTIKVVAYFLGHPVLMLKVKDWDNRYIKFAL